MPQADPANIAPDPLLMYCKTVMAFTQPGWVGVTSVPKIAITVLTIICLYPFPARSQDALGTFMFLFVSTGFDMTKDYGKEFVKEGKFFFGAYFIEGRQTTSVKENCVFEQKTEGRYHDSDLKTPQVAEVIRWNFNKVFADETKMQTFPDGSRKIIFHGDKDFVYDGFFCLSEKVNCEYHDTNENQSNEYTLSFSQDEAERSLKAVRYFVGTFCAGTKRKSAF